MDLLVLCSTQVLLNFEHYSAMFETGVLHHAPCNAFVFLYISNATIAHKRKTGITNYCIARNIHVLILINII